jgi:hypothetical protein
MDLGIRPNKLATSVPSPNAKPLPSHLARKSKTTTQDPQNDNPKADEPFCDPKVPVWSEFHTAKLSRNPNQVKIDLWKPKQLWYYLGKTSTEAKAQYTEDPRKRRNNLDANFLESVRPLIPVYHRCSASHTLLLTQVGEHARC